MKKLFLLTVALVGIAVMVSCEKDEPTPEPSAVIVEPVVVSDDVKAFFNTHSQDFIIVDQEFTCRLINSADEFKAVFSSVVELPSIDFNSYTLVLGQCSLSGGQSIKSVTVNTAPDVMELMAEIEDTGNGLTAMFLEAYWGVFPKLPKKSIVFDLPESKSISTRAATEIGPADYYWLGDEKIPLQKVENKYFVMFDMEDEDVFKANLSKIGISLQDIDTHSTKATSFTKYRTATIEGDPEKLKATLARTIYSAPYYKTDIGDGKLTNLFSIALKSAADLPKLEKLAAENAVHILGVSEFDGWYELACTNRSKGNALEMGNLFYETGMFESVGYDLGARGRVGNINEPLFQNGTLWHLGNNTTNPNIHINYISTRAIAPQASSAIKVAVVDSGVQYGHPDLYNVLPGWDAESQSSPNVITHDHGTNVSGFICAIPNNGQAVAGVAYGATILPISFNVASDGSILSSYDVMVRAVNRAVNEGADVMNCSWTYSDNRIGNAIKNALDSGCIVVFASGNNSLMGIIGGPVGYPANSDPRILVVGAIDKNGSKTRFSDYGSELDVVAPGAELASTSPGSGYNYVTGISGTSFAAPQVAGIAALMLSRNPNLTGQQVESAIIKSGSLYPSRNNEIGYGLVDAYKAVGNTPLPPGPSLTSSGRLLTAGEQQWAGVPAGSKGYWVQPGQVTVSINQYDGAATYQWQTGSLTFNQLTGPYAQYTTVPPPPAGQRGKLYEIRCRATKNGQYSAWSSLWLYVSRQQPETYRAPIGVDSLQVAPKPVDVR